MHIDARLDLDLVALEQADEVTLLLELQAPEPPADRRRPPATVQVVLDRSGSMGLGRLPAAKAAIAALVDRLDPHDAFGLVTFHDEAEVVVPAGPVADREAVLAAVRGVRPGGCTNLSAGLLRGLQEAARAAGDGGAGTVLLVSDGHANRGVVDHAPLEGIVARAAERGITTSTVGIGLGYDEALLSVVARGGRGGHAFAEDGDAAVGAIAGEVDGLLSTSAQAVSIRIRPAGSVDAVTVWNDLPSHASGDAVVVELGDLWAGERRKVLVTLGVPAMAALGLARVAELELRYVALPDLVEEVVTVPVTVNVVPGDQAAGRVPDATVESEKLFQQAQDAKRRAAEAMAGGDVDAGRRLLRLSGDGIRSAMAANPTLAPEVAAELRVLEELDHEAHMDAMKARKLALMEHHRKGRGKGRD